MDWSLEQRRAVQKIQINPLRSESVWAATTEGLYRSLDGGKNWENVHSIRMATDVIISPADTNTIFVAHGGMGSLGHGIYRSVDGGTSFVKANLVEGVGPSQYLGKAVLDISKSNPDIIIASIGNSDGAIEGDENDNITWIMRSDDGGDNWFLVFKSGSELAIFQGWYSHAIAIHPKDPNIVWAVGQPFNIYKSEVGGSSLTPYELLNVVTPGSEDEVDVYPFQIGWADHHDIIFHPTQSDTIYIVNDGGIFKTKNGGTTFINCNSGYQTVQFYNGVSNSNTNPSLFMGGLQDNSSIIYEGSLDWRRRWAGDGAWTALNQENNLIAYLSAQFGQATVSYDLYTSTIYGDFYAFPGSEAFPSNETNFITPYVLSAADNTTMYIGGEKIFKSLNGGINWFPTNSGDKLDGNAMSVLVASEQNPNVVYAASSPKVVRPHVYKTSNGGDTWVQITQDLPDRFPTDMAVDPNNDLIAYITFGGFGTSHVFKTEDGGNTWIDIGVGLPDIPTWSITVDPENNNTLFVGNEVGVYQSIDGGNSWTNINGDLPDAVFAMDLVVSRSDRKLRVATHGNGAYEIDMLQLVATQESNDPIKFDLQQNYPNPFNPNTTIRYQVPKREKVLLQIFDINGRLVTTLVNEVKNSGPNQVIFNGDNLASGTYIYRLTIGGKVQSKTMQLIK